MATREVGLMKLVEPEFLSLVNTPANQTGFKIIRSKQEEKDMSHNDRNLRVRAKAKRADGLLSIEFPVGISKEDAEEFMDSFALGESYELAVDDYSNYYARRTGDNTDVPTVAIDLSNGFVAQIATATMATRKDANITGVTLVGLEFDETFEDVASVKRWMDERDVNFKPNGLESLEGGTAITRHDTPEGTEVRKVRLGDGVTGLVSKTKDDDVPAKVYRSVIEQSYGNWGWGHLNFATALADPAFTDASWDAIWVLQDVLENVVLYSGLPLDDRKVLIQNVCDQFTQYMTSLIDTLPREVIEQARADRKTTQEPDDMAIAKKSTKKVERKDEVTDEAKATDDTNEDATDNVTRKDEETTEDTKDYVTRSDMEQIVADAVAKALAPKDEEAKRSDVEDAAEADTEEQEAGNSDNAMADTMATMAAAMTTMGETMASITRSVEGVKGDIEELGGATVARSDGDDADAAEEDSDAEKAKREDASPFDGMFGDRFNT